MSKTICSTIRRQLDEMMLGEQLELDVSRHLSECSDCRDFHEKQTKLRQIVGSIGMVNAPSDFDFRLRSRLARANSTGSYQLTSNFWLFGQRTALVAAAVVVIVGAVFLVREFQNRSSVVQTAIDNKTPSNTPAVVESVRPEDKQRSNGLEEPARIPVGNIRDRVPRRNVSAPLRNNRLLVSEDQATTRAPLVRAPQQMSESVFPVDASQQSLKVSLFDGRGNPRTISLPTVTFGSQRVVPTTTSFAPKGVW